MVAYQDNPVWPGMGMALVQKMTWGKPRGRIAQNRAKYEYWNQSVLESLPLTGPF
jgi:hypothetical protein